MQNTQKQTNRFKKRPVQQKKKNVMKSSINPEQLIRMAEPVKEVVIETRNFDALQLQSVIMENIKKMGFVSMTPIQDQSMEPLLERKNIIGIASTGTGKTGAFLIPMIENMLTTQGVIPQQLIMVPTRELAVQVYDEFKKLSHNTKLNAVCLIGGTNIETDKRRLANPHNVIIATPGRLLDLMNQGKVRPGKIETLILDEFDKMLDMGFINDIRKIANAIKHRKQTVLFSATIDGKLKPLIGEMVNNPILVEVNKGNQSSKNVNQDIIRVGQDGDKFGMLVSLLNKEACNKVILFTETKHQANKLSKMLNGKGIKSDQIHGNKSMNYRLNALSDFKKGRIQVLVATDVAARGIDVDDVSHVINYQLPRDYDTYIHRVGRTGRAGKSGVAYTFVDQH